MIKDTNLDHFKVDGANFIEYMNDPKISGFGNWMFANGFNSGVWASTNWISVKDRLPERKWIDYLVATRIQNDGTRGFNVAWLNDDNGVWKSNDEWICNGREIVTHWMPLPEPPKEES